MVWVELHENEASRATEHSEYHSLPTGLRKAKAFLADEYLHEIQTHQDQSYFLFSKSAKNHIINLKLALSIVSGEVEYAYCGPSCTAGKSGFFKLKITNILKSSGWGLETNELPCEQNFLEP